MSRTKVMTISQMKDDEKTEKRNVVKNAFDVIKMLKADVQEEREKAYGFEYVSVELRKKASELKASVEQLELECQKERNEKQKMAEKLKRYESDRFGDEGEMKTFFTEYHQTLTDERKTELQKKYSKYLVI